jgi:retinol dehydrogenase-12
MSNHNYSHTQVFLITGSSSGIGKELAQILYSKDARVYVAARSKDKANTAIEAIKVAVPKSKGSLIFLHLDLDDLTTVKKSANEFLSKESRLDVLWNNAGVMIPPQGSKTMQGYELQLGTNCVAPFLFTKFITPILQQTAKIAPSGSVRVVWTSSAATELLAPKNGVNLSNLDYKVDQSQSHKYGVSKAGNFYHATEYAKRYKTDGIISMVRSPVAPNH